MTFLYDINGLVNQTVQSMLHYGKDLATVLLLNNPSDFNVVEVYEELKLLNRVAASETWPQNVLKLIEKRCVEEINAVAVTALCIYC